MSGESEIARPRSEWREDMGDVLWWKFPIDEAPYVGTPNDTGSLVETHVYSHAGGVKRIAHGWAGGWPGYHTHWTPLPPAPKEPTVAPAGGV